MPATPFNIIAWVIEGSFLLGGLILLWRHVFSPAGRAAARTPRLPEWRVSVSDFLLFAFLIIAGGLFLAFLCGLIVNQLALNADTKAIINSAAFQLGLLIGPAVLPLNLDHHPLYPRLNRSTLISGCTTFLIALPVVTIVNLAWQWLLEYTGLPTQQQDLLRMFTEAKEPVLIGTMVILAVAIAPIAEDLLFRATLYRYLRTRVPRAVALWVPGTIFAALHVSWGTLDGLASLLPLVMLAVIFSIAYERTGQIATAMIAHALFNLHTVLLLLSGVSS
jgi:membrane protease YdiL (CAAX protease family)